MRILSIFFLLFILLGCTKDNRVRLFEMVFPNIVFEIPAGVGGSAIPQVYELDNLQSNIRFYLNQSGLDTSVITGISPVAANLTAIDNNAEYDFLREVSIRICPRGSATCSPAEEVFYIDNLIGREGTQLRLLPTLINARRMLVQDRFKLEILFFFRDITPTRIRTRLDMSFEAVQ